MVRIKNTWSYLPWATGYMGIMCFHNLHIIFNQSMLILVLSKLFITWPFKISMANNLRLMLQASEFTSLHSLYPEKNVCATLIGHKMIHSKTAMWNNFKQNSGNVQLRALFSIYKNFSENTFGRLFDTVWLSYILKNISENVFLNTVWYIFSLYPWIWY